MAEEKKMNSEELQKILQKQTEELMMYQSVELASNQRQMNLWMIEQMSKMKEGLNSIGILLSDLIERVEVAEEEEKNSKKEEPKEVIVPKPTPKYEPIKKKVSYKDIAKAVKESVDEVDIDNELDEEEDEED